MQTVSEALHGRRDFVCRTPPAVVPNIATAEPDSRRCLPGNDDVKDLSSSEFVFFYSLVYFVELAGNCVSTDDR